MSGRWELSLTYQRTFAPDLWPTLILSNKVQITPDQVTRLGTAPVVVATAPSSYVIIPDRIIISKPASVAALTGAIGNLQFTWEDAGGTVLASITTVGLTDTALQTVAVPTLSTGNIGPSSTVALGLVAGNATVNNNFQRMYVKFAGGNPTGGGPVTLNMNVGYRILPIIVPYP